MSALPANEEKRDLYRDAEREIRVVFETEGTTRLDDIAMMATINSVLAAKFPSFFWTGFYRVCGDVLIVGPYIGTVGCLEIEIGKGVCGTAAAQRETLIVPDVSQFPGHIACDPRARSEIVVPVFSQGGDLVAVLDIDSDRLDAFDEIDREGLERICRVFGG
ncbi:MAG TPA: GAF domain-containing protein [Thermoanaerobaculia bacterium]|nr:GAF domain-containing protein [Thermoanaerobaculia bacterium]